MPCLTTEGRNKEEKQILVIHIKHPENDDEELYLFFRSIQLKEMHIYYIIYSQYYHKPNWNFVEDRSMDTSRI